MRLFNKQRQDNNLTQNSGAQLVTYHEPKNPVSEQFRTLRTNIEFVSATLPQFKTVLITSAEISDGKTTVASNLAVTWAQSGQSVLYVDADLRRSTAQATFKVLPNRGLTTVLSAAKMPIDAVQKTQITGLDVLTAGPVPPNPAELLGSEKMTTIITWANAHYDKVVIDVPPVLAVTDAQMLMKQVDGVVLVVALGKTKKANIKRTVEIMKLSQTPIIGVIHRDKKKRRYASYGYGETFEK